MTHPPAGPSTPPPPPGPRVGDTIFALAASLGFKDLGHRGPQGEPPVTPPRVAADSEGRAGVRPDSGAVPSLPPMPPIPPWVASRRRLAELGVGPVYHGLPKLR
jgi:hypothetical protein